ncbi:hypothetical protein PQ692_04970 [Thermoanaerobacterium thermosaccharolyticum]|uniref:hypothetical protein n=2 Tax=Thermoanaerobacterium thermosaccharolyticum TaxID=1517 RepID=UPI003DA7B846
MEIVLLARAIFFGLLFVLLSCLLLHHLYIIISKIIKEIKVGFLELLMSFKEQTHNELFKKFCGIRNYRIKLKKILTVFDFYIEKIIHKPKYLLIIDGIILFLFLLQIVKLKIIPTSVKSIIKNILVLIYLIGMIWVTVKLAKEDSILSKIQSFLILAVFVLSFALIPVILFSKSKIGLQEIVGAFIMFLSMVFFCVFVAIKYYYKKMAFFVVIFAYFVILFFGSIAFGEFYWNNYPIKFSELISQLNNLNNTDNIWSEIMIVAKMGIRGFFEFPSQDILCKITVFQFIIGKIMDLVLLGYIGTQILKIKNYTEKAKL